MVDTNHPMSPAEVDKALAEFDPGTNPGPETPEVDPNLPVPTPTPTPAPVVTPPAVEPDLTDPDNPEPTPAPVVTPPADENIDYKQRFIDTAKEGKVLYDQQQDILSALTAEVTPPTDEEIKAAAAAEGLDYELMTQTEQILYKRNVTNDKKIAVIDRMREVKTKRETWAAEIDTYLQDEKVATQLKGREDAFRRYALQPTKIGYPLKEDLVKLFVVDELPKEAAKKGGSLPFTVGSSGNKQEKPEKGGVEKSIQVRTTSQKLWQEQIRNKQIDASQDI